ncbi:MAG TPA: hypothetical protein VEZ11_00680 [Thermoanaerobaculia bacterium]|nr:hypothetical protein [Thermoanaerobaculia bacterium]
MELLLNLIWLVIAVASFAIVLPRASARYAGARRKGYLVTVVMALVCVCALLFPIISVSDDLSIDREAIEELGSLRRSIVAAATQHDLAVVKQQDDALAIFTALTVAIALMAIARLEVRGVPAFAVILTHRSNPRSPPRV